MVELQALPLIAAAVVAAAIGSWLTLAAGPAAAQQPTNHIRNRANPTLFLNSNNGAPTAEQIQPGAPTRDGRFGRYAGKL